MANEDSSKRSRKNMNLSERVFRRIEKVKTQKEKDLGSPLAWDTFFGIFLEEVEKLRKAGRA